jgi:hypothetical protein
MAINPFELLDAKVAVLEPKQRKSRKKVHPEEDYTLAEVCPRMIVSKDNGVHRYMVKLQIKDSIGDRSTPRRVWVRALILLNMSGAGELLVSLNQWKTDGWSVIDFPF